MSTRAYGNPTGFYANSRLHGEFDLIPPDQRAATVNPVPAWLVDNDEAAALRHPDNRPDETEAKYAGMFSRRATKGQCFNQPYLGCREFSCQFRIVKNGDGSAPPIDDTRDLGWMLYDMDFSDPADIKPMFFRPEMKGGVIEVPHPDSEQVRK